MDQSPETCDPRPCPATILITGGAGFIGSHIVDAYIDAGHNVIIVDDLSTGKKEHLNPKAKFYKVDLRDAKKLGAIIAKEKPTIVNHHAAQKSVTHSVADPVLDASVNIIGLINLLEAGRHYGLKKVIFASTGGAIYGDAKTIPTPEGYDAKPVSPYGITKLASEHYLRFYHDTYGLETVVLRYGNVYGPRQDPYGEAGVIAIFAKKILAGEPPTIFGDGKNKRDYVYVGDLVRANRQALTAKTGVFNIGTGRETDVNGIFDSLIKTARDMRVKTLPRRAQYGAARAGEQRRSCLDITHASKVLGWQPKVSLADGVKETLEYFTTTK
jgi:UDP-glucose 4-epimerase